MAALALATLIGVVAASPTPASPGLIVSSVAGTNVKALLTEVFADHGSGASQDGSAWGVKASAVAAGWKTVGHAGEAGYTAPTAGLIVVKAGPSDPAAVAAPSSLALNWQWGTKAAFLTPVCPTGFGALGSVATLKAPPAGGFKPSDFPSLVCVAEKYLNAPSAVALTEVWTNKPTKFKMDGSIWRQPPFHTNIAMPFVAGEPASFSAPTAPRHTLNAAKVQVVVMPTPPPPPPAPLVAEQVHLALGHSVDTMAVAWATVSAQPCVAMVSTHCCLRFMGLF